MVLYSCETIGMNGSCNDGCPIFMDGNCENWQEIENTELHEDEFLEYINNYKQAEEEERIYKGKIEQIKNPNSTQTFKIEEDFIASLLTNYYKGDDTLKNPLKMFKENEALSDYILNKVSDSITLSFDYKIFELDLYLNQFKEKIENIDQVVVTLKNVLNNRVQRVKQVTIDDMRNNFFEADLNRSDFDNFEINYSTLISKIDDNNIKADKLITTHKDFPADLRNGLFNETNDIFYISQEAKDLFIF